jgi:hypothetical protein
MKLRSFWILKFFKNSDMIKCTQYLSLKVAEKEFNKNLNNKMLKKIVLLKALNTVVELE